MYLYVIAHVCFPWKNLWLRFWIRDIHNSFNYSLSDSITERTFCYWSRLIQCVLYERARCNLAAHKIKLSLSLSKRRRESETRSSCWQSHHWLTCWLQVIVHVDSDTKMTVNDRCDDYKMVNVFQITGDTLTVVRLHLICQSTNFTTEALSKSLSSHSLPSGIYFCQSQSFPPVVARNNFFSSYLLSIIGWLWSHWATCHIGQYHMGQIGLH